MLARVAFDNGWVPAILGKVYIPQWNISGIVRFLIDTGSEGVMIGPSDVVNLRIPYHRLPYTAGPQGIGSHPSNVYPVKAELLFADLTTDYFYDITIDISDPRQANPRNPSILGRKVLNRWRILYDHPNNVLDIEPSQYDRKVP
jgi:hypothetical protein